MRAGLYADYPAYPLLNDGDFPKANVIVMSERRTVRPRCTHCGQRYELPNACDVLCECCGAIPSFECVQCGTEVEFADELTVRPVDG